MLLFMAAFVAIVVWLFLPSRKREFDRAGRLPLDDGSGTPPRQGGAR
ncbi:MAG: cbb3-type cytochrome c oxidase subunit 3 [Gemmatimonadetes bacterium]|nr:cbb3-type cytochrome c oxidase subunit 3 [Gemmatimonadota bacterium]